MNPAADMMGDVHNNSAYIYYPLICSPSSCGGIDLSSELPCDLHIYVSAEPAMSFCPANKEHLMCKVARTCKQVECCINHSLRRLCGKLRGSVVGILYCFPRDDNYYIPATSLVGRDEIPEVSPSVSHPILNGGRNVFSAIFERDFFWANTGAATNVKIGHYCQEGPTGAIILSPGHYYFFGSGKCFSVAYSFAATSPDD